MWPLTKALASWDGGLLEQEENESPTPGGHAETEPTPLPDSPGSLLGRRGLGLGWALVLDDGSPWEAALAL